MTLFIVLSTIILTYCKLTTCSIETFQDWRKIFDVEKDTVLQSYLGKHHKENNKSSNNNAIKDDYYRTISRTSQNSCQIIKQFGGRWSKDCGFEDGEKIICIDTVYEAVKNGTCLVYSFGLADDWDFEISMASLGCTVHAYDPTTKVKMDQDILKYDNLHYHKIGIGRGDGKTSIVVDDKEEIIPINTLKTILENNGDDKKEITYLKIDIEGQEIWSFRNWITTNALRNVNQLGIEMHTCCNVISMSNSMKTFKNIIKFMQQILNFYNLKLVAYNPNRCHGKLQDSQMIYYSYHDALFAK